jgi:hypothetical protein
MKILSSPWNADFFKLVQHSKESIKITSPFVKYDVCNELIHKKNPSVELQLITAFKLPNVLSGSLDIQALTHIIDNNGNVRSFPSLHAKIYLFDDVKAVISSGNLTTGGLLRNFEYGVFVEEEILVKQIVEDFHRLRNDERTGDITKADLQTANKILEALPAKKSPELIRQSLVHSPEEAGFLEDSVESIISALAGWKLEVFRCVNAIDKQVFTLNDLKPFHAQLGKLYPENQHISDKIRQQLQKIRDLGLLEFLGNGVYKKLWI